MGFPQRQDVLAGGLLQLVTGPSGTTGLQKLLIVCSACTRSWICALHGCTAAPPSNHLSHAAALAFLLLLDFILLACTALDPFASEGSWLPL